MPLGPSKRELEQLVRFYSLREIAQRYHVSVATTWRWCHSLQIEPPRLKFFPLNAS